MYETFGTSEEKQVDFQQRIMDDCKKQLEDAPFYKKYMLQKQYRNAESSMKSAIKVTHSERSGEWSITPNRHVMEIYQYMNKSIVQSIKVLIKSWKTY